MLAVAVPVLALLYRRVGKPRMVAILLSALVAHTAWHWMLDRGATLAEYQFAWPTLDVAFVIGAMRWAMLVLVIIGVAWGLSAVMGRLLRGDPVAGQSADRSWT